MFVLSFWSHKNNFRFVHGNTARGSRNYSGFSVNQEFAFIGINQIAFRLHTCFTAEIYHIWQSHMCNIMTSHVFSSSQIQFLYRFIYSIKPTPSDRHGLTDVYISLCAPLYDRWPMLHMVHQRNMSHMTLVHSSPPKYVTYGNRTWLTADICYIWQSHMVNHQKCHIWQTHMAHRQNMLHIIYNKRTWLTAEIHECHIW